jgi:hypothetical protein
VVVADAPGHLPVRGEQEPGVFDPAAGEDENPGREFELAPGGRLGSNGNQAAQEGERLRSANE